MKKILILVLGMFLVGCQSANVPPEEPNTPEKPVEEVEGYKTILTEDGYIPFTLVGKDYKLPVSYKEMAANGWEPEFSMEDILQPNTYIQNYTLRHGEYLIKVVFYNNTNKVINMEDALIAEIEAENRTWREDVATDIVAPKDVTYLTSIGEVEEKYGIPTDLKDSAVFKTITYKISEQASISFKFNLEESYRFNQDKDEMRWIILSNFKN